MKYLAIDLGTYSIKTMLISLERKQMTLLDSSEFILDELRAELDPEGDNTSLKKILLENIVPEDFDGKVIYQLPNQMVTSRHLELPVTQKKKVDLMIPFQLDELLPYPSHESHFFSQLVKKEESTSALVNVTKRSDFEEYFNSHEDVLPSVLTTELSAYNSFAQNKELRGPVAFVDIGHRTTKCYIVYKGEVVAHHFSFCAGATIDEVISETYNIPQKDAVIYKHQNCFFLTEGQYDEVSQDQRDFALLMKKAFTPLVLEMKRWLLGFRVKYGIPVESLRLSGGSSNIHNINNFFSQQIGVQADFCQISESLIDSDELLSDQATTYYLCQQFATNLAQRNKPGNFLHGEFSHGSSLTLPLYSAAFYAQRTFVAAIVFSLFLGADIFYQGKKQKTLDRQLKGLLKQEDLGVSASQRRRIARSLDKVINKMERKNKNLTKELNALQASGSSNALEPLFSLFSIIQSHKDIELTEFDSNGSKTSGAFKSKNEKALKNLTELLKSTGLPALKIAKKGNIISFNFLSEGS